MSARGFLILLLCVLWAPAARAADGFGVQIKEDTSPSDLVAIQRAGFTLVRLPLYWGVVEKERGVYDWAQADDLIAAVRRSGLGALVTLTGGNAVYDGQMRAPARAESMDAFARFASAAAARYDAPDVTWEIWNEPDTRRFWPPAPDVMAYNALAARSCARIKQVAPSARVVGPALARVPEGIGEDRAYFAAFLGSQAAACFDAISVHPYRYGAQEPEAVLDDYVNLTRMMAAARVTKPLIRSEWGYSDVQTKRAVQADYALRTMLLDRLWGIGTSIWYEWRDSPGDPADVESGFGLMERSGGAKAAMEALATTLPTLRGARLDRRLFTGIAGQYVLLFRDGQGRGIVTGWRQRGAADTVCLSIDGADQERVLTEAARLLARGGAVSVCDKDR